MQFAVVLFPVLVMVFALGMESLEGQLDRTRERKLNTSKGAERSKGGFSRSTRKRTQPLVIPGGEAIVGMADRQAS